MDILTLTTAALAGFLATFLFDFIKRFLSRKKHSSITVKLPDGASYELVASKGNRLEIEKLVRSLMYSTEKEASVRVSTVRLLEDIVRPSLESLGGKFDEMGGRVVLIGFDQIPAISVDPAAIQQVVFNLLQNAIKYSPREAVLRLEASVTPDAVEIRFINPTIAGANAEDTERIFEMGFRGSDAMRKDPSGAGVGLFVVRNLLKAHGGDVWARSENNLFITTIRLPRTENRPAARGLA
jgi:signal transduction histidine kinase